MASAPSPILIADDEADDVFIVERRLRKAGVENPLLKFHDGEDLIAFLERESRNPAFKPCVLLLDLKMPMVDGIDVLEWIRKYSRLQQMPVVVISSAPTAKEGGRAKAAGADEYHEKYPEAEVMREIVARASAHPFALQ